MLAFRDAAAATAAASMVAAEPRRHVRQPGDAAGAGRADRRGAANIHGRTRETCRLCGECDVGCNYGAKNTLDYTYLTQAWQAGAEHSHAVRGALRSSRARAAAGTR